MGIGTFNETIISSSSSRLGEALASNNANEPWNLTFAGLGMDVAHLADGAMRVYNSPTACTTDLRSMNFLFDEKAKGG